MFEYDEATADAFGPVRKVIDALDLPFHLQRRYNGMVNAIEMQVECGDASREVYHHLRSAVIAQLVHDGFERCRSTVEKVFDEFEAKMASQLQ